MSSRDLRRGVARSVAIMVLASVGVLVRPRPASAVPPDMPVGLTVNQPDSTTTILTWEHVPNATRYSVTVDGTTTSTVNNSFVPRRPAGRRPDGSVTAYTGAEAGPTRLQHLLERPPRGASPGCARLQRVLAQPTNPPLLTWAPTAGATSYKVEVDGDADFVGATSYTDQEHLARGPDPLGDGDWYWRVTASKGVGLNSPASEERRFVVIAAACTRPSPLPPDDATQTLQDVVLDWAPVPGAASYDVQVSTEADFSQGGALIDTKTGILGTRYSPLVTYDNASYFWRVRAIDMSGQATPWTAAMFSFTRNWPDRPTRSSRPRGCRGRAGAALLPVDARAARLGVRDPGRHAGQLHRRHVRELPHRGTTYTPGMFAVNTTGILAPPRINEDCKPQAGTSTTGACAPLDRPFTKAGDIPGVQGLFSETQAFRYMPMSVTNMAPTGGATVDVPTLTLGLGHRSRDLRDQDLEGQRHPGRQQDDLGDVVHPAWHQTSCPADGPFTWQITAVGADRSRSVTYRTPSTCPGNLPTSGAARAHAPHAERQHSGHHDALPP